MLEKLSSIQPSRGYELIKFEKAEHKRLLSQYWRRVTKKKDLMIEWQQVLARRGGEPKMHLFLEKHPYMLPGPHDYTWGPMCRIIASKLPLGTDFVSDFAYITLNSVQLQFVFIEIEDPRKPIFNKNLSFSKHFNQALQQVKDWKRWADENMAHLVNIYRDMFTRHNPSTMNKSCKFFLIYGRRNELERSQTAKDRWSAENRTLNGIEIMTYDRLTDLVNSLPADTIKHGYAVCVYKKQSFFLKASVYQGINR